MTTVFLTKDYMIADKRGTINKSSKDRHLSDQIVTKILTDTNIKIIVEPYVRKLFHDNKRVMALGFAGSFQGYLKLESFLKRSKTNLLQDLTALTDFFDDRCGISLLAFLDNGEFCKIELAGAFDMKVYRNNTVIGKIGSGGGNFDPSFTDLILKEKLTIEEVFLYCSVKDPHSSIDYSVYSLKEDRLYTTIRPPIDYYKEKVLKVHRALEDSFNVPKDRYYGI